MSDAGTTSPLVRVEAASGTPWGALFTGIGALGGALVGLLHLDRLPWTICMFKLMTGIPCPTCGSTRALGRLAALDLAGAVAMNPLAAAAAAAIVAWGVADLVLMTRGRVLSVSLSPRLAAVVRVAVVAALLINWAYLVAAGR